MWLSAASVLPRAACKGGTVSLGGFRDVATACADGLFHLGDTARRGVLRSAQPARRGMGPDRPERSGRNRGGRRHQPPRPQGTMAAAGRREPELYRRPGQLPRADAAHGDEGPVSLLCGRPVPGDLSAVRRRIADFYLVAHPGPGPAQPDRCPDPDRRTGPVVVDLPDPPLRAQPRAVLDPENRRDLLSTR